MIYVRLYNKVVGTCFVNKVCCIMIKTGTRLKKYKIQVFRCIKKQKRTRKVQAKWLKENKKRSRFLCFFKCLSGLSRFSISWSISWEVPQMPYRDELRLETAFAITSYLLRLWDFLPLTILAFPTDFPRKFCFPRRLFLNTFIGFRG